jgi:HSP20 family protein
MAVSVRRAESASQSRAQPMQPMQRWEPFQELEQLHEQMGRLMETVWAPVAGGNGGTWIPLADIEETDDAWVVEAELPSVDRKDINVELRDNELGIRGEIKEKERKGILRRRTRRTGQFEYRVALPGHPTEDAIEADLHGGVLTVRVPKGDRERPRRIDVKAA